MTAPPITAPWKGPYGGVPPFEAVTVDQFEPALEFAMADARDALSAIAKQPAPPNFDNTLAAFARAGRMLERVEALYGVWGSTMSTPDFQAVERRVEPKLAAFRDEVYQNEALFKRVTAVYEGREKLCSTAEQKRLAWKTYQRFVHAGAKLDAAAKKRVAAINQRLAELFTHFHQNVLAEEEGYTLTLGEGDLAGLPPSIRAGASSAAEAHGAKGKWMVLNTRSSVEPFLTYSDRRDLREKVWRNFVSRGDHGDEKDTQRLITEILQLRAERAVLLGFPTHAHWRLDDTMAKTPERAMALMQSVWPAAVARVHEEVADMQAVATKEGMKGKIEPWDYRYYAEKVRKAKYDLDENEVKPYLQLEQLREGMFWVAGQLFDLHFTPVSDVAVYHPDVRVWEVKDGAGKHVGLWYFDPYARAGKHSGAWMNAYRRQERLDADVPTVVSNNANFVKGKAGEPVLISWEDGRTLFHEFGHALHGLCANSTYAALSGTAVTRDYVEFPSQLLERWLSTPEVLNRFALHYKTHQPIPKELVQKIERAAKFNQGFHTVEYLSSALVDMKAHLAGAQVIEPRAFEKETLAALGMPQEMVMRHRMPHFSHIFDSDSYSAGYYSYLWSDTLSADAFEAFTEAKGPYDPAVAARLKAHVFSVGDTVDPAEAYRQFRGHDPDPAALMRHRGFPVKAP